MPYRIDITLLDFAGVFGATTPAITGTLTSVLSGSVTFAPDLSVPIPGAPSTSVLFPAGTSGMFPASVVLSDAGSPTGQVFRSGEITLPPSPGRLTVITAAGSISPAAVTAFGSSLGGTQLATPVADGVKLVLGLFLGFGPPESITITSAAITLTPPPPMTSGPGSLSITITGSLTYRLLFIVPFTQAFTISTSVAISPSGDGTRTDRIVAVTPSGKTLSLMVPSIPGGVLAVPFNVFNGTLVNALEPLVNRAIVDAIDTNLHGRTPPLRRTPTCVISARRIGITSAGISAQLMLADFGPAVVAAPRTLALSVTPAPVSNVQHTYTFRVVDRADQSPVAGATVALTNHNPTRTDTQLTDAQGEAKFMAKLQAEILGSPHNADPHALQPYAVATAPGAQAATLILTVFDPL